VTYFIPVISELVFHIGIDQLDSCNDWIDLYGLIGLKKATNTQTNTQIHKIAQTQVIKIVRDLTIESNDETSHVSRLQNEMDGTRRIPTEKRSV
jgi:hypothetical protein